MDIKFLRGLLAALPSTRDDKTFYYTTDSHQLWLGNYLLSNEVTADQFNALETRVKALEDADFQGQIDAIEEQLKSFGTSETITALDGRVTALEQWKAGLPEYVTKSVYDAHLTAQGEKDAAQDKALNDYKAEMVETLKGYQTTIPAETYDAFGAAAQALEDAKDYTDEEITGLEFALSEDGKTLELKNKAGTAVATLDTTDFVVDGMLTSVVADQTNNKLTFTWNTVSGIQETEIELSSIADIYTGSTNADEVNVVVSNTNAISATVGANVKADIAKGVDAQGRVTTLEGKVDVEKVSTAIATATADMATNANVDKKLEDYTKTSDLGDLATRDEADLNLGQYMKTADHETFVSGNAVLQSGITAAKVGQYDEVKSVVDTNKAVWDAKQAALTADQLEATNSGITAAKVAQYDEVKNTVDTNKAAWSAKQNALSEAQLAAANSGITAAKVGQYDALKSTVDENKAVWDKAGTALQAEAISDMATKTFVANTYVAKEGYYAYSAADQQRIATLEAKPAAGILSTDIEAWNAEKGAKELAGQKATLAEVKAAYIGETNTKLIDVVKAVNMLAEGSEATDKVVEDVATNVKDIEAQLTWGSF